MKPEEAKRLFRDSPEARPFTVLIDGFTIHRGLSGEVNGAS